MDDVFELSHNNKAGACSTECKEQIIAVRMSDGFWRGVDDLKKAAMILNMPPYLPQFSQG